MKMKKILSVLLAVVMLASCFSGMTINAYAKTSSETKNGVEYYYTIKDGKAKITGIYFDYDSDFKGELKIPSKLGGKSVTTIGKGALWDWEERATSLVIPDSVTTVEANAFISGYALKSVSIGSGLKTIRYGAFASEKLKKITVSSKNKNLSAKNGVLYNKDKTKIIAYPAAKTSKEFKLPSTVTEIAHTAFTRADITKIVFPDKLKTVGDGAFRLSQIKSAKLPETVTSLGYGAYEMCDNLTSVDLSKTKIKSIERETFSYSQELSTVELPETLTDIKDNAFRYNSISTLALPSSLKNISDYAFSGVKVKSYKVGKGNKNFKAVDGVLFNNSMTNLISYPSNNKRKSYTVPKTVTKLSYASFASTSKLESVDLSKTKVKSTNALTFRHSSVKEVKAPSTLEKIDRSAFEYSKLEKINLSNTKVKKIGKYAFSDTNLKKINLPSALETIERGAFEYSKLKEIDLSNTKVTKINEYVFEGTNIKEITIPSNIKSIGEGAFESSRLEKVTISKSVESIGRYAFMGCEKLKDVYIKNKDISFGRYAFEDYSSVTLHASKGSTTEAYANRHNINFVKL